MDESLKQAVGVLAVAMIVAVSARQIKAPYTIGLFLVGAALSFSHSTFGLHLTHDLVYDLILPPLLFEAALAISLAELRRDAPLILALAAIGTFVSAGVVACAMIWLLGWPPAAAMVFGALIAATDPVAIISMFKDYNLQGRMRLLVETESLLNDGAGAVLFVITLTWAQSGGHGQSGLDLILALARMVLGGLGVGAACGVAAIFVAGRTTEHMVEAALTTVAAFGSFLLAEDLDVSGVLATVTTGLIMGNLGVLRAADQSYLTTRGREFVVSFWEFAAFLANSVVFLLIGVDVAGAPYHSFTARMLIGAVAAALAGRALAVYPISLAFRRTRWFVTLPEQHVLWWSGLRGALGLALALSLPSTVPLHDEILAATFAVVGFSIIVQGLTMPLLLRRQGFLPN